MKKGDIIKHVDLGDKFYLVFDVTDSYHEIEIGSAYNLHEAKKICKNHSILFPGCKLQIYEVVREQIDKQVF